MIGIVGYSIVFVLLLAAFLGLPVLMSNKKNKKKLQDKKPFLSGIKLFGVVLLSIALLFEVFVANFKSFHVIFGDYEPTRVDLTAENVTIKGIDTKNGATKGNNVTIEIKDIDQPVGTLHLELDMTPASADGKNFGTTYVDVKISATDETQATKYRSNVANGQIIRGDERSEYITLDLSGKVDDLKVVLTAPSEQYFGIKSMAFNQTVPMQFSVIRLLAIVGIVTAIYGLCKCPAMLATYGDRKKALHTCVFVMTMVMILVAMLTMFVDCYEGSGEWGFVTDGGNQMTKELVDAFEKGQVHLTTEPSDKLLAMENPYDWEARKSEAGYYLWDHLLYEGKYYSYYGIAPVALLFLPYHMITGEYFNSAAAIFLFGALGIMFLSLLFLEFCGKFCKKLPNNILLCTLFIMQMSSGVWYNFMSPLFYEIAQSSGFLCTCAGFYFLLKSNVIGGGLIKYRHIVFATMFLSLAVLCRPTLAVYCIAALAFLAWGFVKHRETLEGRSKQTRTREITKYLVASLVCFVVIGGVQMWYNYARFGNILDFGIQYSLTINDFTKSQYHTDFAMIGFYNFLFAFPLVKPEFPYVFSNYSTLDVNGYYFTANRNAVGLFFRALPTLGLAGSYAAFKRLEKREKWQALSILLPTCVIAPLVIIFSIWESGYGVRYCCDFAWQFILGGAAVLFFLYAKCAEGQTKRIMQAGFVVAAVVALLINGAMLYDYMDKGNYLTTQFMSFERLFDFWF